MKFADFAYMRPQSLTEALEILAANEEATLLAGGQSLLTVMSFRLASPELMVDISHLPELTGWTENDGTLILGTMLRHAQVEDGALPGPLGAFLARAAGKIGYRAIRNRGTVGGSLAHADPAADWPTTLAALGADVELASVLGRRRMPVLDFLEGEMVTAIAPGEMIVAVHIPVVPGAGYGTHKIARKSGEFANAIAAATLRPDGFAISVGLIAGKPMILTLPADTDLPDPADRLSGTPAYLDLIEQIAQGAPDAQAYPTHLAAIAALHAAHDARTARRECE